MVDFLIFLFTMSFYGNSADSVGKYQHSFLLIVSSYLADFFYSFICAWMQMDDQHIQ